MDMNSVLFGEGWQPGVTTAPMPQAEAPAGPPAVPAQLAQAPAQAQVPANQQQYEQDWLTKMRTDPAISQAMMFAASRLMQGQKPGQSQVGMLGDALAVGMTAHSMLTENERKAGLEERKVTSEEQYKAAHTEGQQIANEEARAMGPDKIKAMKLKIQALERTDDLDKARAPYERLKAQFLSMAAQDSTGQIERIWLDELQSPMLERQGKQNLQAAQTRQANAHAGLYEAQTDNPEKFKQAGRGSAKVEMFEYWKRHYADLGYDPKTAAIKAERQMETAQKQDEGQAFLKWTTDNAIPLKTPEQEEEAKARFKRLLSMEDTPAAAPSPAGKGKAAPAAVTLPAGVPEGSVVVGTSDGKRVWQDGNGVRYKEK